MHTDLRGQTKKKLNYDSLNQYEECMENTRPYKEIPGHNIAGIVHKLNFLVTVPKCVSSRKKIISITTMNIAHGVQALGTYKVQVDGYMQVCPI